MSCLGYNHCAYDIFMYVMVYFQSLQIRVHTCQSYLLVLNSVLLVLNLNILFDLGIHLAFTVKKNQSKCLNIEWNVSHVTVNGESTQFDLWRTSPACNWIFVLHSLSHPPILHASVLSVTHALGPKDLYLIKHFFPYILGTAWSNFGRIFVYLLARVRNQIRLKHLLHIAINRIGTGKCHS